MDDQQMPSTPKERPNGSSDENVGDVGDSALRQVRRS